MWASLLSLGRFMKRIAELFDEHNDYFLEAGTGGMNAVQGGDGGEKEETLGLRKI